MGRSAQMTGVSLLRSRSITLFHARQLCVAEPGDEMLVEIVEVGPECLAELGGTIRCEMGPLHPAVAGARHALDPPGAGEPVDHSGDAA